MPQIIEWTNAGADAIIWRYPTEDITWGAQLIVHEYEMAVFFRDGKAYDVFGPGRHTLTTLNLPVLTSLLTRIAGFGGNKPFKATVLFISTKVFAGKWGTKAQTTELAPLQTYGQFWFKVADASLFVNEVVGGQNAYTTDQVNDFLRGFLNEKIIDELSHYDLVTVFTRLDETSVIVKNSLIDYFKRVGIELTDLQIRRHRHHTRIPRTTILAQNRPNRTWRRATHGNRKERSSKPWSRRRFRSPRSRHGTYPTNHEPARNPTGSARSSPRHLSQMRRKSSRHKQILPQLRNQSNPTLRKRDEMPQLRQIHPSQQQILS